MLSTVDYPMLLRIRPGFIKNSKIALSKHREVNSNFVAFCQNSVNRACNQIGLCTVNLKLKSSSLQKSVPPPPLPPPPNTATQTSSSDAPPVIYYPPVQQHYPSVMEDTLEKTQTASNIR